MVNLYLVALATANDLRKKAGTSEEKNRILNDHRPDRKKLSRKLISLLYKAYKRKEN